MTSYSNYLKEFEKSTKALLKFNRSVSVDEVEKFRKNENVKILLNYYIQSINDCKAAAAKEILKTNSIEFDNKAAASELYNLIEKNNLIENFSTLFNAKKTAKYWNLNSLFEIVFKTNFEKKAAAAKLAGKKIELKNSDFLTIPEVIKFVVVIWYDNKDLKEFCVIPEFSKKYCIVRVKEFISDYINIKAAAPKKAAAPEISNIQKIANLKDGEFLNSIDMVNFSIMDIIKKAAPNYRIDCINKVIQSLNDYKAEFENSLEFKNAIEKKENTKIVDKAAAPKKSSSKKSKKAAAPEDKAAAPKN